jgi:plasmid stabilization system protein ParE
LPRFDVIRPTAERFSSKSTYTSKQKRQARHIEEGYKKRGVARKEAARRAWATVNEETGRGKKSGAARSASARKAAATRKRRVGGGSRKRSR